MGLGLPTSNSNFDNTPVVKMDARAGRVFKVDRTQQPDGSWASDETEITQNFVAAWDMANIEVGYMRFAKGMAPDWQMVKIGQPLPPKPSPDHKAGFRVYVYSKELGKREFASQAKAVLGSVDAIQVAFENAAEAKAGKLPVVRMNGSTPIKSSGPNGSSTNYAPVLEIVKWVDRPAALNPAQQASDPPKPAPGPATRGATPVPPPPPPVATAVSTVAAPGSADDDPFA